jgi:pyruvate/2-oxoglutarate/acetoin dehydrogenase E1 component
MSEDWNTKYGTRRVRRDPPTLEEAIFAAVGITDDQQQQAEIAAALMGLPYEEVLAEVKKTGRAVTVEEGWQQSGVGAEIAARIMEQAFDYLDAPVMRVSGKDVPMPYAANLEKLALPNVAEVVAAAKAVTYR